MKTRTIIYPGTFDPITRGHIDIIKQAVKLFDKVIIVIADNENKNTMFSLCQRKNMIMDALHIINPRFDSIELVKFDGLVAQYEGVDGIIRGVRTISDVEYEINMARCNEIVGNIPTILIPSKSKNVHISSSAVRELIKFEASDEILNNFLLHDTIEYIRSLK